ncbi:MAG: hypothetical protein A3H88_01800 [Candidatus Blackburnbacteria bacterium RIFCSPLOWO2_02_FULL_44_9]|uniref:Type II toxin-antitoxin system RelE/ParE family toxin n=1 Tax=Candidatus Blackburnbacteria bacterium RIFCSPHIGHO2_02_FULL_44_20 TaxID=1797516 RepID=A0A1G1VAA9_9BACT|nr:MAG: hypothetical protein A3E16_02555 [Candidatus Blackburnbacteria bacterium RIFCSPHIGHO2_12_FULL_44_25]OGY12191.1 MAG: hypothetical protein A3D26_01245 [Candidatus Blackburnbacteria bacterium RIFCSPHIGHO2_02_FULL_44_20]OGY15244.1 MAG: hypothetical protein A3A62_01155 [Candidatus Blackburnbacteria bacterium RIFCSPLOWO2_01_FULL_44_43]OGY16713.1 MAG: hypothetical protein A3H88_01800 [Candidatus Blackburnbacteria bacterium RIFCSPLOWO2_02_FULL_44_9]
MYKLLISPKFANSFEKLPPRIQDAVRRALQEIKEVPYQGKPLIRELTGRRSWRVGVYRIIYRIKKKDKVVLVIAIDHRSRIYN